MSNVTLAIDDEVLKRARIRALEEGTSVNAAVRDYLVDYAYGASRPSRSDRTARILSAALQGGCRRILTEGLQNHGVFDGVVVENPFA